MFCVGADATFLVADRLAAWSLDLATASLALHALAWTRRHLTFGARVTDDAVLWMACDELFFLAEMPTEADWVLAATELCDPADWDQGSLQTLFNGGGAYRSELGSLNVTPSEVRSIAMHVRAAHPRIFVQQGDPAVKLG